jgi:hypothetical protein
VATGVILPEPPSALILATGILAVLIAAGAWKQHLRTCPCASSTRSLQGAAKG